MLNSLLLNMYVRWLCDTDSFSQLGAAHLVGYLSCHMWALLWNGSRKTLIKILEHNFEGYREAFVKDIFMN